MHSESPVPVSSPPPDVKVNGAHGHAAPPAKASPVLGTVVILLIIGLAVWTWKRVDATLAERKALEKERDAQAQVVRMEQLKGAQAKANTGRTVKPDVATWTPQVKLEGTLGILREADLPFMGAGKVTAVHVKNGDRVVKGQTLATLETDTLVAQVNAAEAQVRATEAQLVLAQDNANRTVAMVKGGAMPESAGFQATGQVTVIQAQIEAAKAQVALLRVTLPNYVITSPVSGVVTRAPTVTGTMASPGVPVFHVVDTSQLKFSGTVAPEDAALLKVGAPMEIQAQGRSVLAKVTAILPSVDPLTRRVPVEAVAENDPKSPIYAGALVRGTVKAGEGLPVLKLPATARRPGSQDEVMVVRAGQLEARRVQFIVDGDGSLLVRSGIQASDDVLVQPSPESKAGDQVQVPKVTP